MYEWTSSPPVDWRFPLVSRLPDAGAQAAVVKLLGVCWERGFFWKGMPKPERSKLDDGVKLHPALKRQVERIGRSIDRSEIGDVFVVYGSCARGDARRDSDVDLLAMLSPRKYERQDCIEQFEDMVDEVNLGSGRQIDPLVVSRGMLGEGLFELPQELRKAILSEGMTVYSTLPGGGFIIEVLKSVIDEA